MRKTFKCVEVSQSPVTSSGAWGYLMLAKDGECWKVALHETHGQWQLGDEVMVYVRQTGPDQLVPDWSVFSAEFFDTIECRNRAEAVAKFWGEEVAADEFPDYKRKAPVTSTSDRVAFSPSNFADSGKVTSHDKALFANTFVYLVTYQQRCFDLRFFTKSFYQVLCRTFGFGRDLTQEQFSDRYFSTAEGKFQFLSHVANHSPSPTSPYLDVETVLSSWVKDKWLAVWAKTAEKAAKVGESLRIDHQKANA